jgi:transcription elongation factor Elf1
MSEYYYAMMCKNCGKWQSRIVTENSMKQKLKNVSLNCIYCGKSTKVNQEGYGLSIKVIGPFSDGLKVAKIVSEKNMGDKNGKSKKCSI